MLGLWCQAGVKSEVRRIFFRPSFAGREHCADFDDGVTFDKSGFSNDSTAVGSGELCEEYVFDKVERVQDAYVITARCGRPRRSTTPLRMTSAEHCTCRLSTTVSSWSPLERRRDKRS
jgi:hypothetical protein